MNRTCTVLQQGLTVGDREDRGEPFVHRASIARFFPSRCSQVNAGSATILHGPSRWIYGVNRLDTVSTRFDTVHPGRAPLPGPPRFTKVVFDMSKTTGKTPGSSRSIRHHPGPSRWTTVQPPVLPGSPRSMDRGEPGSTGSPVGLGHKPLPLQSCLAHSPRISSTTKTLISKQILLSI